MAETGKMYLQLFHGRRDPKESLDDWGEQGPIFGPLQYVHTTYIYDIKIEDIKGKDGVLKVYDDMVYYDGMYYGDWSAFVLVESTQDIAERHQEFDQEKANLPPQERPSNCECDNTHEQNNTCCMPCWNAGFRTVARKGEKV